MNDIGGNARHTAYLLLDLLVAHERVLVVFRRFLDLFVGFKSNITNGDFVRAP